MNLPHKGYNPKGFTFCINVTDSETGEHFLRVRHERKKKKQRPHNDVTASISPSILLKFLNMIGLDEELRKRGHTRSHFNRN